MFRVCMIADCQSGSWSISSTSSVTGMELLGMPNAHKTPASCPLGWTQVSYSMTDHANEFSHPSGYIFTRLCIREGARAPIYIRSMHGSVALPCPAGWVQADYSMSNSAPQWSQPYGNIYTRTCY